MARISGVDIPDRKRGEIALTYIFGIGRSTAKKILDKAGVDLDKKVLDWTDEESGAIRSVISGEYKVEGALKVGGSIEYQTLNGYCLLPWPSSS